MYRLLHWLLLLLLPVLLHHYEEAVSLYRLPQSG